jgi:hypothetical protein
METKELFPFIALENFAFVTNRTVEVSVSGDELVGIKVLGSLESSMIFFNPRFNDARAFIDKKLRRKNLEIFRISFREIGAFEFDARKVWGLDSIPHFGIIFVKSHKGRKLRRLVLLGAQAGEEITDQLNQLLRRV